MYSVRAWLGNKNTKFVSQTCYCLCYLIYENRPRNKNNVKMNLRIVTKNHAAEIEFLKKSI